MDEPKMKPGDRVEIVGLEARAEMNGLQGVLIRESVDKPDRWEVLLESESKRRVMKCCNLSLVLPDAPAVSSETHAAPAKFEDRTKNDTLTSGVSRERFKAFSDRVKGLPEKASRPEVKNSNPVPHHEVPIDYKSNTERDSRSALNIVSEPKAQEEKRLDMQESPDQISPSAKEVTFQEADTYVNASVVTSSGSKDAAEKVVATLPDLPEMQKFNAEVEKLSAEVKAKEDAVRKADEERRAAESARQAAEAAKRSAEELLAAKLKAQEEAKEEAARKADEERRAAESARQAAEAAKRSAEELSAAKLKAQEEVKAEAARKAEERRAAESRQAAEAAKRSAEESTKVVANGRDGDSLEDRLQQLEDRVEKQSKLLQDLEVKFTERFEEKVDAALESAEIVTEKQSKLSDMLRSLDEGFSKRLEAIEEKLAVLHQGKDLFDSGHLRLERDDISSASLVTKEIAKLACKMEVLEKNLVRSGVLSVALEAEMHRTQFELLCASSNWCPSVDFSAVSEADKVFGELAKFCCAKESLALRAVSTVSRGEKQNMLQRAAEESIKQFLDSAEQAPNTSATFPAAPRCELVRMVYENAQDTAHLERLQKWLRQAALWQLDQCQECSSSETASFLEAELHKFQEMLVISADEYADGKEALRRMRERKDAAEERRAMAQRKLRAASAWATSKDTTKLEQAIRDAKIAGVDSIDVASAETFLRTLRPGNSLSGSTPTSRPTRRSSQPPKRTSPKSLYGFLQETMPSWPQYSLVSAIEKLEKISITTVTELRDALHAEGDLHLTNRLRDAKLKVFKIETLESLMAGCGELNE